MGRTIRIDDDVWQFLKENAEPLVDTPNDVLRRFLPIQQSRDNGSSGRNLDIREKIRAQLLDLIRGEGSLRVTLSDLAWMTFVTEGWPPALHTEATNGPLLRYVIENRKTHLKLHLEIGPGDQSLRRELHAILQGRQLFTGRRNLAPVYNRVFRRDLLSENDYRDHGDDADWLTHTLEDRWADFMEHDYPRIEAVIAEYSEAA